MEHVRLCLHRYVDNHFMGTSHAAYEANVRLAHVAALCMLLRRDNPLMLLSLENPDAKFRLHPILRLIEAPEQEGGLGLLLVREREGPMRGLLEDSTTHQRTHEFHPPPSHHRFLLPSAAPLTHPRSCRPNNNCAGGIGPMFTQRERAEEANPLLGRAPGVCAVAHCLRLDQPQPFL